MAATKNRTDRRKDKQEIQKYKHAVRVTHMDTLRTKYTIE